VQPLPPESDQSNKAAFWLLEQRSPIRSEFGPSLVTGADACGG
jgi:hypothetical protein